MKRSSGRSWRNVDELLDEWAQLTSLAARPVPRRRPRRLGSAVRTGLQAAVVLAVVGIVGGVLLLRPDALLGPAASPAVSNSQVPPTAAGDASSPEPTLAPEGTISPPTASPRPPTPLFPPPSPTPATLAGEWRMLPTSPLQDGRRTTAVWTGAEFIVWGTAGLADGAAYDPATDTWRQLPDGPPGPARYMAAAWTGDVVVAWHGGRLRAPSDADGGIYDPATDSWTPISPGPLSSDYGQGVAWTGSELLVLSPDMRATAYDRTTDTWRDLPSPPLAPGAVEADWTGTEWLVLGFGTDPDAAAEVAAFDPQSGTWSRLAASPMTEQDLGRQGMWTGESWLWLGWESLAYDRATDQWRTVDTGGCPISTSTSVWTGGLVLGSSGAFDPETGACAQLPPAPQSEGLGADPAMAWTGMELLLWGGSSGTGDTTTTDGAVFTPAD